MLFALPARQDHQGLGFRGFHRALVSLSAVVVLGLSAAILLSATTTAFATSVTFANKVTSVDGSGNLTVTFPVPAENVFESQVSRYDVTITGPSDGFTLIVGTEQSTEKKCSFGSSCSLSLSGNFDGDTSFTISLDASVKPNEGSTTRYENFSDSGLVRNFHATTQLPSPSLSSSNVGLTSFTVNVSKSSNANAFFEVISTTSNMPTKSCGGTQRSGSSITYTGRDFAREYYVFVCVANTGTDSYKYDPSDWKRISVTTLAPNPRMVSASSGDQESRVSWEADVGTITVQYKPDGGSWQQAATSLTGSSYTVTGLDNGTLYYFRVIALYNGTSYTSTNTRYATPDRNLLLVNFQVFESADTTKVYDGTTDLKSETFTGTVDPATSTVTSDDGTSSFQLSYGGNDPIPGGQIESGDGTAETDADLQFSWTLRYDDKNVGVDKVATFNTIQFIGGADEDEWDLSTGGGRTDAGDGFSKASITPKDLTLNAFAVGDKTYDGTADADNGGSNPFSDDRVSGDDLSFSWTAAFSDKNVAVDKTVSITGISISGGADQNNYGLVTPSGTTEATISKKDLTLSNFSAEDKIYDGTTDVPVGTFDDDRLGDDVLEFDFTAAFAAKDVKANEDVDFSGITISGGDDQGNYNLLTTSGSGTANIVERPIHLAGTRVYDATRLIDTADVAITDKDVVDTGLIGEETLVVGGAGWIETKNVGASLTLEVDAASGDDPVEGATGFTLADGENGGLASNYTFVGGTHTVTVTQAPATIDGMEGVERIYDGSSTVELDGGSVVGIFEGDVVAMANNEEGEPDSPDVGKHDVTTEITLAGLDAPNYLLTQPVPEVEITSRELTVSGLRVQPKIYDGSNRATLTGATLNNVAPGGSAVSLTGATTGTFASPNAGVQSVAFTLGLTGANASNYTLVQPGALSGRISPAAAQIRFVSGLTLVEGATGAPRVVTIPAGLATEVVFAGGQTPTEPGEYTVQASITDPNYEPSTVSATLTIVAASEDERVVGLPTIGPVSLADILGPGLTAGDGAGGGTGALGGLTPGQLVVIGQDGVVDGVSLRESSQQSVVIDAGDFALELQAEDDAEQPRNLNASGRVELVQGTWVRVTGNGFAPGGEAEAWLFSDPRFIGAVQIDSNGAFEARLPVADDIAEGVHTLQLNALDEEGQIRSVSLGVEVVVPAPAPTVSSDSESGSSEGSGLLGVLGIGAGATGSLFLLGLVAILGLAFLGWLWWWLVWRRRKRDEDEEEVYVPREFEIDRRVDSEYRR